MGRLQAHYDDYIQQLINTNKLRYEPKTALGYPTIAGALGITHKFRRGVAKSNKLRQRYLADMRNGNVPPTDIPVALEARSFQALRDLRRRKLNRQWKMWLVLITLGLFLISFGQLVETRLLFSRRPHADVTFKIIAIIAFGSGALWLEDPILTLLAVFVALTIRQKFDQSLLA